jgi:2-keto-4-pentenoate hydratase/2-oxohepta-3-ene-1,7-dioic acid hydratase in catechol pathway
LRLVHFIAAGQSHWGAAQKDMLIDLNLAHAMLRASHGQEARFLAADPLDFIRQGQAALDAAKETLDFFQERTVEGMVFKKESARLLAPLTNPSKIVAIGLNYGEHRREQDIVSGEDLYPVLFPKFPSAIIGPGDAITWDPALTQKVDYEAELGVVMGRRARNVPVEQALDYVFGYLNLNDVSARDLQFDERGGKQWTRGKSLDTFCPLGPYLVTRDDIPNPQDLSITTIVNGEMRQVSNTANMINSVAQIIAFISRGITLMPGDIIATGTPSGVGHHRKPPVYLAPGDVVQVEIEGLGQLTNPIEAWEP